MRGLKWLAKLAVSALVTAGCCVAFTFMAVNTYVDLILEQLHIERPASAKIEWGPFVSRLAGGIGPVADAARGGRDMAEGGSGSGTDKKQELAVAANGTPDSTKAGTGSHQKDAAGKPPAAQSDPYRVPEDAVAVWSRQTGQSGTAATTDAAEEERRVVVSGEDFAKKKDQLSDQAKGKIFSTLVSRVPPEDMQHISRLMEDGLTAAEMKEVENILQKHLKPEEYRDLLAIIETP
ncbi:hypothetical protein [Paenibacillus puerhi]|uniref:hypothetical protein n=1 Tax=Paenibacillus puerhi TaxID=2692622 RepID=UPI00135A27D6|nr:hypothetical protein [Paenibacillus puerhi]